MFAFLEGKLSELNPTDAVIDVGGVGYALTISLKSYEVIKGKETVKLYTHLQIRDDAHVLFGFATPIERKFFRQLISVSGVGPSTAMLALSTLTVTQLYSAIVNSEVAVIQKVKGIGGKTAQRITIDLKDKMIKEGMEGMDTATIGKLNKKEIDIDKAVTALVTLGYTKTVAQKSVNKIVTSNEGPLLSLEEIIKQALKMA